jgi:hypothetical protein
MWFDYYQIRLQSINQISIINTMKFYNIRYSNILKQLAPLKLKVEEFRSLSLTQTMAVGNSLELVAADGNIKVSDHIIFWSFFLFLFFHQNLHRSLTMIHNLAKHVVLEQNPIKARHSLTVLLLLIRINGSVLPHILVQRLTFLVWISQMTNQATFTHKTHFWTLSSRNSMIWRERESISVDWDLSPGLNLQQSIHVGKNFDPLGFLAQLENPAHYIHPTRAQQSRKPFGGPFPSFGPRPVEPNRPECTVTPASVYVLGVPGI